jgi:hypothetical protein
MFYLLCMIFPYKCDINYKLVLKYIPFDYC